jgi:glycosyltransferase involved in cell wall biosynthesis
MTIVYLCNWDGPSGGIKVLYDHVRVFRARRFDAALGATGRFARCVWFQHDSASIPALDSVLGRLTDSDWLVVPDIMMGDRDVLGSPARKIAFIQNHSLVPPAARLRSFDAVMVASAPLAGWLRNAFGAPVPIHVVEGFLEDELVAGPRRWEGGPIRALVTPRMDKSRGEPLLARTLLRKLRIAVTTTTSLMHRDDFVRLFRCHPVYLHLSYPEGFPCPVLEAFGAGCLVIGFAGMGGLHFMRDGVNSLVVDDGDWRAVVELARQAALSPRGAYDSMLDAARQTARAYDERRLAARLEAVFGEIAGRGREHAASAPEAAGHAR